MFTSYSVDINIVEHVFTQECLLAGVKRYQIKMYQKVLFNGKTRYYFEYDLLLRNVIFIMSLW
jgi:hypothetical protein